MNMKIVTSYCGGAQALYTALQSPSLPWVLMTDICIVYIFSYVQTYVHMYVSAFSKTTHR